MTCDQVEQKMWRYADRELSAQESVAMSAHISTCGVCRATYHEHSAENHLYREAVVAPCLHEGAFGDHFTARCMESLRRDGLIGGAPRGPFRSGLFQAMRSRPRVWAAAAVAFVVFAPIVGVLILGVLQPTPIGWFEVQGEPVRIGRVDSQGRIALQDALVDEGPYFASWVFQVPEGSRVLLEPEDSRGRAAERGERAAERKDRSERTVCEIPGPSTAVVDRGADRGRFRLLLSDGALEARVAKLSPDEEFEVRTPHGRVRVVGTRFHVKVGEGKTALSVREGTVAFTGLVAEPNAAPVLVAAGESWVVEAQGSPERVAAVGDSEVDPETERLTGASPSHEPPMADTVQSGAPSPGSVGSEVTPDSSEPGRRLLNGRAQDLDTPVTPEPPRPRGEEPVEGSRSVR